MFAERCHVSSEAAIASVNLEMKDCGQGGRSDFPGRKYAALEICFRQTSMSGEGLKGQSRDIS
jgi:hypothetical protein